MYSVFRLHGSYEALADGHLADALVDFTGGVSETLDLKANDYDEQEDKRSILFEKLVEEVKDHSVMCSVITVSHVPYIYFKIECKELTLKKLQICFTLVFL